MGEVFINDFKFIIKFSIPVFIAKHKIKKSIFLFLTLHMQKEKKIIMKMNGGRTRRSSQFIMNLICFI